MEMSTDVCLDMFVRGGVGGNNGVPNVTRFVVFRKEVKGRDVGLEIEKKR